MSWRALLRPLVALLSAIFLATYHYAIHYGRMAINNIWDTFFAVGVLYFCDRGLTRRRLGASGLVAAFFVGSAVYFPWALGSLNSCLMVYLCIGSFAIAEILRGNGLHLAFHGARSGCYRAYP